MRKPDPAWVVIAAGVCAAIHIGKLPPAIPVLQQALGLSLVQAGFALSLVQLAGMCTAIAFGAVAEAMGLRRSVLVGLALLAAASAAGSLAQGPTMLLLLRAVEGLSFLLVVLPAPGLLRRLVPPQRLARSMGLWSAYMPVATSLALLLGPLAIDAVGWRGWWVGLAVVTALAGLVVLVAVPDTPTNGGAPAAPRPGPADGTSQQRLLRWWQPLWATLSARGPWLVSLAFAAYSTQWIALIGFLPTIYQQAGHAGWVVGVLTALVSAGNIVGNVGAGRLLHAGAAPARLMICGYLTMAAGSVVAFADLGQGQLVRFAAVLLFSVVGGLIPATLFALATRVAPSEQAISATVGWMQQWSAAGQFVGPPLVAWVAGRAGGWHNTWCVTAAAAAIGCVLTGLLVKHLARQSPGMAVQ